MCIRGWYSPRGRKSDKPVARQGDRPAKPGAGYMGRAFQAAILVLLALGPAGGAPQDQALVRADRDRDNWRLHGRTYDNQRFSPLTGIDKDNVGKLALV